MDKIGAEILRPPRGTRDFLPEQMMKRNAVLDAVRQVFESYGYDPLGTPAFENWELLKLKSGEEVKEQIYYFRDKSGRELGLRPEMTPSLARVVAGKKDLLMPFKRYAVGPVWRYERPSSGRFREFYQADVDIVGSYDPASDAEVIAVAVDCLKALGFREFTVKLNDRRLLEGLLTIVGIPTEKAPNVFRVLDKLAKIGTEEVSKMLMELGLDAAETGKLLDTVSLKGRPDEVLSQVRRMLADVQEYFVACTSLEGIVKCSEAFGFSEYLMIDLSLARGLDYYTGPVFEVSLGDSLGSVAGGGRYDELIEAFGGRAVPATGISLGIERILVLLDKGGFFKPLKTSSQVFVGSATMSVRDEAIRISRRLREAGLRVDLDLMGRSLTNQLEYADKKGIGVSVIVGERELKEGCVLMKDMAKKEQAKVRLDELVDRIRARFDEGP